MSIDTLITLIVSVISLLVAILTFLLIIKRKKGGYDLKNDRVILEDVRDSFEKQIYALNDRLIQSEERWKDVNHLLLRKEYLEKDSSNFEMKRTPYTQFLKANGILENDLVIDNRLIFVLTPFNNRYYDEFKTIQRACEESGYRCIRGDEDMFTGDIFPAMLKYILRARIVIANINGRNSNVLYELGVAQALDKNVILVAKEPKDLPVDIKSQRFLIYSDSNALVDSIKAELKKIQ